MLAFVADVQSQNTPAPVVDEAILLAKVRRLAVLAEQDNKTPTHLRTASSMLAVMAADSSAWRTPAVMDLVMAGTDTMTTDELEQEGLWLTQCEIDFINRVPCHDKDFMFEPAGEHEHGGRQLYDLQYSDIDSHITKWGTLNGAITYCFHGGSYSLSETTKSVMRVMLSFRRRMRSTRSVPA